MECPSSQHDALYRSVTTWNLNALNAANVFCWVCKDIAYSLICHLLPMLWNVHPKSGIPHYNCTWFSTLQILRCISDPLAPTWTDSSGAQHCILLCSTAIKQGLWFLIWFSYTDSLLECTRDSKLVLFVCLQVICGDCLLFVKVTTVTTMLHWSSNLPLRTAHTGNT